MNQYTEILSDGREYILYPENFQDKAVLLELLSPGHIVSASNSYLTVLVPDKRIVDVPLAHGALGMYKDILETQIILLNCANTAVADSKQNGGDLADGIEQVIDFLNGRLNHNRADSVGI